MKFFTALLALVAASSTLVQADMRIPLNDIKADSTFGLKVLGKARKLEEDEEWYGNQYQDYEQAMENTWVAGYSIKFQGCHHISQWNAEADQEEDVRIFTKRLVRFRLCPSTYCMAESTAGCSTGYGDYIIDMETYLAAYLEAQANYQDEQQQYYEQQAQYYDENGQQQGQYNNNGQYNNANNYNGQYANNANNYDAKSQMLENYVECAQANFGRRQLDEANEQQEQQQYNNNNNNNAYQQYNNYNANFYIGPYCASQGGAIYLGVFTDDTCTTFADDNGGRDTYASRTGMQMPYGQESIVGLDCISCSEDGMDAQYYNYYENDAQDADDVLEICETLYDRAGKCESNLPYGTAYEKNDQACNYMEGIKIVRKDGTVMTAGAKASRSAKTVISFLAIGFCALCGYVYFLKTKLERASINLNSQD